MNFLAKNKKILILAIAIVSVLFFSNYLFAYDEIIIHPSLTEEMVKFYNFNYKDDLTKQEIDLMRKGSTDEDINIGLAARSANHFYNPFGIKKWVDTTPKGEIVPEIKLTSKEWAHDSLAQATSPGGDYTWERAIKDYASGNKERAYEGLGHILHLIEDAAVPAHVRNDLHISPKDFEEQKDTPAGKFFLDYEPYESWTGNKAKANELNFNFAGKLFQENKKLIILNNLDEYFDEMAIYTNTRFFSKDTIYTYSEPKNNIIEGREKLYNGDIIEYVYGFDENNNKIKLAKISYDQNKKQKIYTLIELGSEIENNIYSDYWSRLAPKSVLIGAGVIKLFKDEAEKAAMNYKPTALSKLTKYPYDFAAWTAINGGTVARNGIIVSLLIGNGLIYGVKQAVSAATGSLTSVTNPISQYFSPSAKAQLIFDISSPIKGTTVAEILEASKTIEANPAPEINKIEPAYDAKLILDSGNNLTFDPGHDIALSVKIKNTGEAYWEQNKISLNFYSLLSLPQDFYHPSWPTKLRPAILAEKVLAAGETGHFDFIIKSPLAPGKYDFIVRPVWQNLAAGGFNWLGNDIAVWHIEVRAPEIAASEIPIAGQENIAAENGNAEIIPLASPEPSPATAPNDNASFKEVGPDINAGDTLAIAEAERLQEEEDLAIRRKRARAWAATPPETAIVKFPENPTAETAADFKFSSNKNPSSFYCSLDGAEFALCEETAAYKNLSSGAHNLKVQAKDEYGNIDETPAEYSWIIEALPPKGSVFNINKGIRYEKIQDAVDGASVGDEIQVDSGTYYENINVNKRLALRGVDIGGGRPIVDSLGKGSAITTRADGSAVEGFTAINSGKEAGAGIFVRSNNNSIKNNNVSDNYYGIYLENSNNNILSGNTADSNDQGGIVLVQSARNTVDSNTVSNNSNGIHLGNDSYYNTVSNNVASFNKSAGLYIGYGYENILKNNTSKFNPYGIFIFSGARNKIYRNNFINNSQYNVDDRSGITNIWDDGYPSGGNYWSDYSGTDLNSGVDQDQLGSDGIGDTAYSITCNNFNTCGGASQDQYPLMKEYQAP